MFVVVGGKKHVSFKRQWKFLCALMNLFKIIIIKSYIMFVTESNCKLYFLCIILYVYVYTSACCS